MSRAALQLVPNDERRALVVRLVWPEWAAALIMAELEHDDCDSQSDYYATKTTRVVALAWSKHKRDVFSEMRKAAATFPQTAHLGPGCDIWTPHVELATDFIDANGSAHYKGQWSNWHHEIDGGPRADRWNSYATEAEARAFMAAKGEPEPVWFGDIEARFAWALDHKSIEHREKYSMGHGYYLKATGRYGSGWRVAKTAWRGNNGKTDPVEIGPALSKVARP